MVQAEISLDSESFDHKPSGDLQYKNYTNKFGKPKSEIMVLGARVGTTTEIVTPTSLSKAITQGQTWSPFVFNVCPDWKRPRRVEPLFKSCQVLAVDFDCGQSVEQIEEEANTLGIEFNIIHHSFSSTPEHPKFRGISFLDEEIKDFETVKKFNIALAHSFSKADTQCVDAARLYFGSTQHSLVKLNTKTLLNVAEVEKLAERCNASSRITKSKLNELKPEESEWGNSTIQRRILRDLTPKKRKYLQIKVFEILKEIRTFNGDSGSRYECLWRGTSRLARMPELVGSAVYEWVMENVQKNPYYKNWDKNPHDVVMSAIQWSASHADEAL